MDIQSTKIELIELLLSTYKESVLMQVKAILEESQKTLSTEDYEIIKHRREQHQNGNSKSYSWQEIRKDISS